MEHWFAMSDHEVKVVILVAFDRATQAFIIERYEEEEEIGGQGLRPKRQQRITISRQPEVVGSKPQFQVDNGEPILKFRHLFLREPQGSEADIIVNTDELKDYAAWRWRFI